VPRVARSGGQIYPARAHPPGSRDAELDWREAWVFSGQF
jgi:hypothetical protein